MENYEELFEHISEKDKLSVWRYAKIATCDDYAADDIYQAVMINVWQHCRDIDEDKPISSYLRLITKQKISDFYRKRRPVLLLDLKEYDETADYDTLEEIMERENKRELLGAINSLPRKYQQIVMLHYFEGDSLREISGMLKIKYDAVLYRHKTALKLLKNKLDHTVGGSDSPGRKPKMTLKTFILMFGVWEYA